MKKKVTILLLKWAIVIAAFVTAVTGLNYIFVDDYTDPWFRIMWHNYYKHEGTIDNVYLGTSHVYCSINPQLMDELTGESNFDLATERQKMNSTYYLLKEAVNGNDIKHVYIDMFYVIMMQENYSDYIDPIDDENDYSFAWKNLDYMKNSVNKLEYISSMDDIELLPNIVMPFVRYREKLDDFAYYKQSIEAKSQSNYKNYEFSTDFLQYRDQGYLYNTYVSNDEEKYGQQITVCTDNSLGPKSVEYLDKIVELCKDNDIELTLFTAPVMDLTLVSAEDYDHYIDLISEYAEDNDLEYYDFNLAKDEYLPIHSDEYFWNDGHLNAKGAEIFTKFFHQVTTEGQDQSAESFYDSYNEKLADMDPTIFGIYYHDNGDGTITCTVASNRDDLEYNISSNLYSGEAYVIQGWDTNKTYTVPSTEHGHFTLNVRNKGEEEPFKTMVIAY